MRKGTTPEHLFWAIQGAIRTADRDRKTYPLLERVLREALEQVCQKRSCGADGRA